MPPPWAPASSGTEQRQAPGLGGGRPPGGGARPAAGGGGPGGGGGGPPPCSGGLPRCSPFGRGGGGGALGGGWGGGGGAPPRGGGEGGGGARGGGPPGPKKGGASKTSVEDAVQNVLTKAASTMPNMRWFQVIEAGARQRWGRRGGLPDRGVIRVRHDHRPLPPPAAGG
ncbi:MAG: dodecin domain-containing protein [Holophagaceae bacterium]|nr:dodecin domain-containing protein [Holophagaceae bacterium]